MKISTIMMSACALMLGASSAFAADNLMEGCLAGATGQVEGMDAPLVQDGWTLYNCSFEIDPIEETLVFGELEDITENWPANVRIEKWNDAAKCSYEDEAFTDPVAFFRWDSNGSKNYWFTYEVDLPSAGMYTLECKAGEWNNYNEGNSENMYVKGLGLAFLMGTEPGPEGIKWMDPMDASDDELENMNIVPEPDYGAFQPVQKGADGTTLMDCVVDFTTKQAGKHYVSILGSYALFAVGDITLTLTKAIEPGAGVDAVEAGVAVSTKYYGLNGMEVVNPAQGSVVIEKTILDNGKVNVAKRVIR